MTPNRSTTTAAAIAVFALLAGSALAQAIPIEVGTWMIRGTPEQSRWVEVHQIEQWNGTQLFHVELLGHKTWGSFLASHSSRAAYGDYGTSASAQRVA